MAGRARRRINPKLAHLKRNISGLFEDEENARHHEEESTEGVASSLRRFGQQKPIVALESGRVIAGNGTLRAARHLGWKQLAVVIFDDEQEEKARAYAIADNRTAELSSWNADELEAQLKEIDGDVPELKWDQVGELSKLEDVDIPVSYVTIRFPMNAEEVGEAQRALEAAREASDAEPNPDAPWSKAARLIATEYLR